jgi:hypothetical protein
MQDDPIDLSALDPDADPAAEDRFVGAVMTRVAATPNPYPVRVDALWGAWSLARPVLLAASVVIAIAGIVLTRQPADDGAPLTVAESVGVPMPFRAAGAGGPIR